MLIRPRPCKLPIERRIPVFASGMVFCCAVLLSGPAVRAATVDWLREFDSTHGSSLFSGMTADERGNVFLAGTVNFDFSNSEGTDGFLVKYDSAGNQEWIRHTSAPYNDEVVGYPAADAAGNLYGIGTVIGSHLGLVKYDDNGNILWIREVGAPDEEPFVAPKSISTDGLGNVFVGGLVITSQRYDTFLELFDSAGNDKWYKRLDLGWSFTGVAADGAGRVYVADDSGISGGDALLGKYDASGNRIWDRVYGADDTNERSSAVAADGQGNAFIAGWSDVGSDRVNFMTKYDAAGNFQWTTYAERASGSIALAADEQGNVYLAAGNDIWKYDGAGGLAGSYTFPDDTFGNSVAVNRLGDVFVGGSIAKNGHNSIFVAKISGFASPEPSSLALGMLAVLFLAGRQAGRHGGR